MIIEFFVTFAVVIFEDMNRFASILLAAAAIAAPASASADSLVLLHTNDTHSLIYPDGNGRGGVLQRKAIIDSVRRAEKNVVLIDAGDAVQGTLFFKFFKGDVEYPLMDMMGYDMRILGNHEFDNGVDDLARHYRGAKVKSLSTNYDFKGTALDGIFERWSVRNIGGKRIGFMGLNVDPRSLITEENSRGVVWHDIIKAANATAEFLKKDKKCDLVVAITHIGYTKQNDKTTDVDLARASHDIDIIIGGHSHTLIDPAHPEKYPHLVKNAGGRDVLIAQTGKSGRYLGYVKVDLDKLKGASGADYDYELIPVTDRFAKDKLDRRIEKFLAPYRARVDSVNNVRIGVCTTEMKGSSVGAFANWTADFGQYYGTHVADSLHRAGAPVAPAPDLAIMNIGGIRQDIHPGYVTEGQVLSTFPFSNRMVLLEIKGADLAEALGVAARKGGEAVSDEVRVTVRPDKSVETVIISGNALDPERTYLVATIDYLAWGNDDLDALGRGRIVWSDSQELSVRILEYIRHLTGMGMPVTASGERRFVPAITLD